MPGSGNFEILREKQIKPKKLLAVFLTGLYWFFGIFWHLKVKINTIWLKMFTELIWLNQPEFISYKTVKSLL